MSHTEPDYEALRIWALHPSSVRPAGMAQLLRGGLVTWLHMTQAQTCTQPCEVSLSPATQGGSIPLSTLIATMIAEVLA